MAREFFIELEYFLPNWDFKNFRYFVDIGLKRISMKMTKKRYPVTRDSYVYPSLLKSPWIHVWSIFRSNQKPSGGVNFYNLLITQLRIIFNRVQYITMNNNKKFIAHSLPCAYMYKHSRHLMQAYHDALSIFTLSTCGYLYPRVCMFTFYFHLGNLTLCVSLHSHSQHSFFSPQWRSFRDLSQIKGNSYWHTFCISFKCKLYFYLPTTNSGWWEINSRFLFTSPSSFASAVVICVNLDSRHVLDSV